MALDLVKGDPYSHPTASSHVVDLPPYVAGDRWFLTIALRASNDVASVSGWTLVANHRASTSSSGNRNIIFYRDPDGTEGSTVTLTPTAGGPCTAQVTALDDADLGVAPVASTGGNSNTTDVTTQGSGSGVSFTGSAAVLSFAGVGGDGDATLTLPTGYTEAAEELYADSSTTDVNSRWGWKEVASSIGAALDATSSRAGRMTHILVAQEINAGTTTITPSTVSSVATVNTPTITNPTIITPATVNVISSIPEMLGLIDYTMEPAPVEVSSSLPDPTVQAGAVIAAVLITVLSSLPDPGVQGSVSSLYVKIKIEGVWVNKPLKVKVAGVWVSKPIKVKVGGVWQ